MKKQGTKIVVVGAGQVGATTAYTLLLSGLASELVLIDLNEKKARGEVLDLAHGIPLCTPAEIKVGTYADCENADIVILTAGANQKPGETRMDLTRKNIAVFRSIVPQVVKYASHAILLVVTNPCDVLTYVTWKISGLPSSQVIGWTPRACATCSPSTRAWTRATCIPTSWASTGTRSCPPGA